MPSIFAEIETPLTFTRFQALPGDAAKPGHYPGVLIIEKGLAKGHFAVKDGNRVVNYQPANPEHASLQKFQIVIGDDTLNDVVACGLENETSKCKLDHGATVRDIVGDYAKFRRDGDQVRADLTLMDSTGHRAYVEELFKKFSKKIGNSIDFDFSYDIKGDVAIARCRKLNSVDIVDAPAATKSLFNENPNNPTPPTHMPLDAKDLEAIGNLVDTKLTAHKTEITTQLSALTAKFEEGEKDEKKEEKEEKDEEKDSAKMSEIASKAALAAVEAAFPKAQREQFAKLNGDAGVSKFEQLIQAQLAAGAPNRGIAIQRAARDHRNEYNAHLAAVNAGTATL